MMLVMIMLLMGEVIGGYCKYVLLLQPVALMRPVMPRHSPGFSPSCKEEGFVGQSGRYKNESGRENQQQWGIHRVVRL
jgi:hypothetical protein